MLNKVVNAGKIQAPRDRQGHRRPVDEHRVSGDGEGKEEGGQESSGEHDSRRSGRCSSSGNSMKTRRNIPLPFISWRAEVSHMDTSRQMPLILRAGCIFMEHHEYHIVHGISDRYK